MTFYDVIEDIKKLIGLDLQSIRPGANIRILEVDEDRSCLILQTSAGTTRSRPLGELQLIWNEMNRLPAVHVDEVLHGSGTSRNQPETILANLPYVEWLKLDNKKHIAFVGKNTHPYGTLKQMDSITASNLHHSNDMDKTNKAKVVIVSSDFANTVSLLQNVLPGALTAIAQGVYSFEGSSFDVTILSSSSVSLAPGTYAVPEMLIKLRQGVGRLIRCETDTGVISILDSRAATGSYVPRVKMALLKYPTVDSVEEVKSFMESVKGEDYYA